MTELPLEEIEDAAPARAERGLSALARAMTKLLRRHGFGRAHVAYRISMAQAIVRYGAVMLKWHQIEREDVVGLAGDAWDQATAAPPEAAEGDVP